MNAIMTGNPNMGLPLGAMGAMGGAGMGGGAMGGPGGAGMGGGGPPRGGGRALEVTREEMEAIQRLQTLGFSQ